MAIEIDVPYERSVVAPAAVDLVFDLLSDVPESLRHFPDLTRLEPQGEGFVWHMKKLGVGKVSLQTVYGVVYRPDREGLRIPWTPMDGIGNAVVSGEWVLGPEGERTRLTLRSHVRLMLGLSRLLRPVAEPLAIKENTRLIDGYLDNLLVTFGGGNGRLR